MLPLRRQLALIIESHLYEQCPPSHWFQLKLLYALTGREAAGRFLFGRTSQEEYDRAHGEYATALSKHGYDADSEIEFLRQL